MANKGAGRCISWPLFFEKDSAMHSLQASKKHQLPAIGQTGKFNNVVLSFCFQQGTNRRSKSGSVLVGTGDSRRVFGASKDE